MNPVYLQIWIRSRGSGQFPTESCDFGCHGYAVSALWTSGATAEVSGLAALLVSLYPRSRYEEMFPSATADSDYVNFIEGEIERGCVPMSNDPLYAQGLIGAGRIDAYRSLTQWGTITANTTIWNDRVYVSGDLTIAPGKTLTIEPGTIVYFAAEDDNDSGIDPSRVALEVQGTLIAEGTAENPIIFKSFSDEPFPGDWFGIYFSNENASGTLSHCKVQDARYGVQSKTTIHISDCEITNCLTAGVYMWDTLSTGDVVNNSSTIERCKIHCNYDGAGMRIWDCPDTVHVASDTMTNNDVGIWVSNARPRITNSIMSGNISQGLWVTSYQYPTPYPYPDVEWCHMQGNGAEGIKCQYNAADISYSKSWQNGTYGLLATGSGAYPSMDHSKVIDNPSAGVRVESGAHAVLGIAGVGSSGYNSIYGSQTKHVYNATATAVYAQNCWWGSNPPNASKFQGQVVYTPYLTSDPVYYLAPARPKTPMIMSLDQNFPNPFNGATGSTTFSYSIPSQTDRVVLKVYDVAGRMVRTLVDRPHAPGYYSVRWDGRNDRGRRVAPGLYFCSMNAGRQSFTKKMVLVR